MTGPDRVRIPADTDPADRLIWDLTGRQVVILTLTGMAVWFGYLAVGRHLPLPAFILIAIPVAAAGIALAFGHRDGLSADRLAAAALRHAGTPKRQVLAPDGIPAPPVGAEKAGKAAMPLRLPIRRISRDGVVDLGEAGLAVIAEASTVGFTLRAVHEQRALIAGFGRWLNSLPAPVQIVVRSEGVDLTPMADFLQQAAPALPHPALEDAAREHAAFLTELTAEGDLRRTQVLLVFREPRSTAGDQATNADTVLRRAEAAARALASADITLRLLDGGQATAVLAITGNPLGPHREISSWWSLPHDVITTGDLG